MFYAMQSLMLEDNAELANFYFKTFMAFSKANVAMAVKRLIIPLVYIRPFTTYFFGDDTFNFGKYHSCKKCKLYINEKEI